MSAMEKSEKDLKVQMSTQAWITSFAIMDIDEALSKNPNMSLKEYIDGQTEKTNIWAKNPDFQIYNLGTLFMMAYAFLVVPKESIEKYNLNVSSSIIEALLDKIKITNNREKDGLSKHENIIRHIRNSLAHANFDYDPVKGNVIFIDKLNKEITFNGEMKINDFKSFLSEYFKTFYQHFHSEYIAKSN